jgi:hypothetical protein
MSSRPLKKIRLLVSEEFVVPEVYNTGDPSEIEEALWIGATIQSSITGRRGDTDLQKLTNEKEREINSIRTKYAEQEKELRNQLLATKELITKTAEQARKEEKESFESEIAAYKGKCEALEARKKELEASRDTDIQAAAQRAEARSEALMQKVIQAKEDQIARMEAAHARLQDGLTKHSEELLKLSQAVQKKSIASANVKTKGSEYESEFRDKLIKAYGLTKDFSLKETRLGSGHEMDFVMMMEGHTVMWEVKNYSAAVPKQEVDKFLRDLRGHAEARIGVMISRTTDITGKVATGDFTIEMEDDTLMIYLSQFETWTNTDEIQVFQTLAALFRIWWSAKKPVEEETSINREELIKEIEKQQADVAKRRTEWRTHKGRIDDMLRWTTDLLEESENRLDKLLKSIRGVDKTTLDIPEGIFRDVDDEKSREWVSSILSVCKPHEGSIPLKDLVDKLSEIHKLSKDTIRSHVKSILLDSAIEKGKGNVVLVKGLVF